LSSTENIKGNLLTGAVFGKDTAPVLYVKIGKIKEIRGNGGPLYGVCVKQADKILFMGL